MTLAHYTADQFEHVRPQVEETVKQWNERIRRLIRNEMRLNLRARDARFEVPVRLVGGWPSAVEEKLAQITDGLCPILQQHLPSIRSLGASARDLQEPLPRLAQTDQAWNERTTRIGHVLEQALAISSELEQYFRSHCDVVGAILAIEEDVLGAYVYNLVGTREPQRIEIYYPVVGLVAPPLEVSTESLSVVVLAHELAHAYSHLGCDINEHNWDTSAFGGAESAIKEAVAQYFTFRIAFRLRRDHPDIWNAYSLLVDRQPEVYRIHLSWGEDIDPEAVRQALLICRNRQLKTRGEFEEALVMARDGLAEPWDRE